MTRPEGERLAVLEQKFTDLDLKVTDIATDIKVIRDSLSNYNSLKEEISELKKQANLWKWLSPTLAAVAGSVLTFLIIEYLKDI